MAKKQVLRVLRARVRLANGGTIVVRRGEELPKGLKAGEKDRLKELDAVGEPFSYGTEEAQGPDVTPADLLASNPEQEGPTAAPGDAISSTTPNEELDAFVADKKAEEVVDAASDPETAQALLDAELSVREDKARKTVVEGLVAKGATDPDGNPNPPKESSEGE